MQPIDRADPRPPNVQIAAAIRAAILAGEIKPGTQLQSGQELARFFGVARQTVQTAINTRRDEGFVRGPSRERRFRARSGELARGFRGG
jgi:putative hydrolases of HD superfamily